MNFRNILIGMLIGTASTIGGVYVGDTQRAKIDTQNEVAAADKRRFLEALNSQRDVSVLAIRWCGHLEMVVFFKANGESDATLLGQSADSRLNGLIARAKRLPTEHVYAANIARNCGTGT